MTNLNVLVLDDEKNIANRMADFLVELGYDACASYEPEKVLKILKRDPPDILISDIMMPGLSGLRLLKEIRKLQIPIEVIMVSAHGDMDMVIEAMQYGAVDFIRKPFSILDIQMAIERTGKYLRLQNRLQLVEDRNSLINRELENSIERNFIGTSAKIRKVLDTAIKAGSDRDASILITGENGTGKEIIARIIHQTSERKNGAFFPVNCSAIPGTLIESEFFGHQKGSFTDAREDKKGFFELTDGGSLFLDEIADMPVGLQAKLLRAIEEKKIKRVGSTKEIDIDMRIISATNQNIEKKIEDKQFRIDLYHRINTITICLPPLRERPGDIAPLLTYFLEFFARRKKKQIPEIAPDVLDKLLNYDFPGNVRELRNMVERALILSSGDLLTAADFPVKEQSSSSMRAYNLEDNERNMIKEALIVADYNQNRASKLLGISRDSLIRRMNKFSINIEKNFK